MTLLSLPPDSEPPRAVVDSGMEIMEIFKKILCGCRPPLADWIKTLEVLESDEAYDSTQPQIHPLPYPATCALYLLVLT